MESLPPELQNLITSHCGREVMKTLRLVSRSLQGPATRRLFSTLYVKNTDSGVDSYQNILSTPQLAKTVSRIVFQTSDEPEYVSYDSRQDESPAHLSEGYQDALESVCKFPNMSGVGLHFSNQCSVPDPARWYLDNAAESFEFRTDVMKALLRGLNNRDYPTPSVRSLSLNNLQNVNNPEITESENFHSVLSRLSDLRLKICNEWEEASPESSWSIPAMHNFLCELVPVWLEPLKANLTSLKLHADVQWGYIPKDDFRGLYFPKLRTLELGNYTFSHDWQLEWILSHEETLEELVLDDCPIVHYARHFGELDEEGYSVNPTVDMGPPTIRTYDQRWSYIFAQMECRLPKLKSFQFGIGPWGAADGRHFENGVLTEKGIGEKGYIVFDRGIGPTPWIENTGRDQGYCFPTPEFEHDKVAYEKLMKVIEGRRSAVTGLRRT